MNGPSLAPFEADILQELLDAQRRLRAASPSARPGAHKVARRTAAITVGVAASIGAATTVIVAADSTTSSRAGPRPAGHQTTTPIRALTVAAITRRAAAALDRVDDMVLHVRETRTALTAPGARTEVYESWWDRGDPEHGRTKYSRDGRPVYDLEADSASPSEIYVDYEHHTWYRGARTDYSHAHLLGPLPDLIRKQLNSGDLTLAGRDRVDGHDALHLARHDIAPLTGDIWVDATTYLVVRTSNAYSTTDYEWLPRNAASLAELVPVIPAGFMFGGQPPETPNNGGVG